MSFSEVPVVTVDSPQAEILKTKTELIQQDELPLAQEIADKLYLSLQPYIPAAGMAAPQIGINKAIFIFSYDRDPKNLEVVINPTIEPLGDEKESSWECCLSVLASQGVWKSAKVPRYEKIKATYLNLNGEVIEKVLVGFAAKVFQHEYDHLQGYVNIRREDAEVKEFETKEALQAFMQSVKKKDATRYIKPS